MNLKERALALHKEYKGKIAVTSKVSVKSKEDLSLAYSPGVAEPCRVIYENKAAVYDYTAKGNLVAVVSDGTAVLGLGNIGPEAALPVMEGKAILFKEFAGIDAFPICLNTTDVDKIVETVALMEPTFGGINLEDIAAPRCFEIEEKLKSRLSIPVFHDDQHGTAIVTLAGIINALKVVNKSLSSIRVVVNGAGAAGIAIVKLLTSVGVSDIILCDTKGSIYEGREIGMNPLKEEIAKVTNKDKKVGNLTDVITGMDVFIGVSAPGVLTKEMIATMNKDAIIFAMANPTPEILPEEAYEAGAKVVCTGRSDYPNQVNNVLAFPGVFKGALAIRATKINEEMKLAAANSIASLITDEELQSTYVIPSPFDDRVVDVVSKAVIHAGNETGVNQI